VTSTVPLPGGAVAVIRVSESETILVAAPPKLTLVAWARPVPVMVTVVPPAAGPVLGDTAVTVSVDRGVTSLIHYVLRVPNVESGPPWATMKAFSVGYVHAYAGSAWAVPAPAYWHSSTWPTRVGKELLVHAVVPRPLLSGGQVAPPSAATKPH